MPIPVAVRDMAVYASLRLPTGLGEHPDQWMVIVKDTRDGTFVVYHVGWDADGNMFISQGNYDCTWERALEHFVDRAKLHGVDLVSPSKEPARPTTTTRTKDMDKAAQALRDHGHIVKSALESLANGMREAAKESQEGHDRAMTDPGVKTAQDDSLITTNGLYQMVQLFEATARQASAALSALEPFLPDDFGNLPDLDEEG